MSPITFTLNGVERRVETRPDESLLEVLRHRCGITSLKDGCSPQGQCGCCLALVDGNPKMTCAVPAAKADGAVVLTLEGVSAEERDLCARAFAAAAGVQCGFCIPGIALRAKWLLDHHSRPTRQQIAKAIDAHLCRCTGYLRIIDAIELMARARRGEADAGAVERRPRRPVARALPGGRLRARRAGLRGRPDRARTCSTARWCCRRTPARASCASTRRRRPAIPAWCASRRRPTCPATAGTACSTTTGPASWRVGEETRCVGDVLAAVAAVDEHTARAAARLVEVDYEVLPPVVDPVAALEPGAPRVNPTHENLLSRSVIRRGDADAALAASAHVVSGTWQTQRIEHLYLEPESALAEPLPDGRLHLYTQGQGIFDDRRQVAASWACRRTGCSSSWSRTAARSAARRTCRSRRRPRCSRG